jgi:ABC-type lipoprotein export system ATPase subunit
MIEINKVNFNYSGSDFKLKVDNLVINQGSQICLSGPSGTGKSTFLKLLSGELFCTDSEIVLLSHKLSQLGSRKRQIFRLNNIGLIFQVPGLLNWLTVKDNIFFPYQQMIQKPNKEIVNKFDELCERAGIKDLLLKMPQQLSLGEQQKVATVRALLPEHKVILADEPTASLDQESAEIISRLILSQCHEQNSTLIYVSHNIVEQEKFKMHLSSKNWYLSC